MSCHMRTTKVQISLRGSACASAQSDQRIRSLVSAFVVRCLDSIISLDSIVEISRLQLASVSVQAGLCLAWLEIPEDMFCPVMAHIFSTSLS